MTLHLKSLLMAAACLLFLVLLLCGLAHWTVQRGFARVAAQSLAAFEALEQDEVRVNVRRVQDALAARLKMLADLSGDWAEWDDTCVFIQDGNEAYRRSNLVPEGLKNLGVNAMLFVNPNGHLVAAVGYDPETRRPADVPASVLDLAGPASSLWRLSAPGDQATGLVMLPEAPALTLVRPIVSSKGEGPVRGTLMVVRFLDSLEIASLGEVTHLAVSVRRQDEAHQTPEDAHLLAQFSRAEPVVVRALSEARIAGYAPVADIHGKPVLLLRVVTDRHVYQRGVQTLDAMERKNRDTLWLLMATFVLSGTFVGGGMLVILERSLLSRLSDVDQQVAQIGRRGDFGGRLSSRGNDELTHTVMGINEMLDALGASHRLLEQREREMALVLANVPTGLLSLDGDFRVVPGYSTAATRMLGQADLDGRHVLQVLGLTAAPDSTGGRLVEYLDMLRREALPETEMAALSPVPELVMQAEPGGAERILTLRFLLMRRWRGQIPHLLVAMEDVTEARSMAQAVETSRAENLQLREIARSPEVFREFLMEALAVLRRLNDLVAEAAGTSLSDDRIVVVFRGIHTVKGMAEGFGLAAVCNACSCLEDELASILSAKGRALDETGRLQAQIAAILDLVKGVCDEYRRLLGEAGDTLGSLSLPITLDEFEHRSGRIQDLLRQHLPPAACSTLVAAVQAELALWREVPAARGLAPATRTVPVLLARSGRQAQFVLEGQDVRLDCQLARALNPVLMHLLRNAVVHGIESAQERVGMGKPATGRIRLRISRQAGQLTVSVSDDGKGLDPDLLRAAAVARGLLTAERAAALCPNECHALIFGPGFTTVAPGERLAGRGMGLAEVRAVVEQTLHGEIRVTTTPGQGCCVSVMIPLAAANVQMLAA